MKSNIKSLFLISFFSAFCHSIKTTPGKIYGHFFNSYQQICLLDNDDPQKIMELKILLEECEHYYNGLLPTPDPTKYLCRLAIWACIAQCFSSKGFCHYLCCFNTAYYAAYFIEDLSRFHHKNKIRQQYAQLESLMAGIKLRLSLIL